ncbi:hypothetical protein RJ641_023370 [Dillenia turbinata]|uniref:Uncharacterized protein n=1 Tax=Dillenia turbinata TaxID=194707 RepID=A0AAN8UIM2_9MAGN
MTLASVLASRILQCRRDVTEPAFFCSDHVGDRPLLLKINGVSSSGAVFHLWTTIISAGIMALPAAVKELGLRVVALQGEIWLLECCEPLGVETMIVELTSCSSEFERQAFPTAGLNECLEKPLDFGDAYSFIEKLNDN